MQNRSMDSNSNTRESLTWILALGALTLVLATLHLTRGFQLPKDPVALEQNAIARNLAEGVGFVTPSIRPLALSLMREHGVFDEEATRGMSVLPDISHAPAWPALLSLGLRLAPTGSSNEDPWKDALSQDRWVAGVHMVFWFLGLILLRLLAGRLLDSRGAWVATLLALGCNELWLAQMNARPDSLGLIAWLLVAHAGIGLSRSEAWRPTIGWSLLGGLGLGLACLTDYAQIPLAAAGIGMLALAARERALPSAAIVLGLVLLALAPWLLRNHVLCGKAFGTAGFSVLESSIRFPENSLQGSLHPYQPDSPQDASKYTLSEHGIKMRTNLLAMTRSGFASVPGGWLGAFFLAGLLYPFRSEGLRWLRLSLAVLLPLGWLTQSLIAPPEVVGTRVTLVLAPLAILVGTAVLLSLIEAWNVDSPAVRNFFSGTCIAVCCLPLGIRLVQASGPTAAYPPIHPATIHWLAEWTSPSDRILTDVPGAVAWYADRHAVWLVKNPGEILQEFHSIAPIQALYLTQETLDQPLVSGILPSQSDGWGAFVLSAILQGEIPDGFPLRHGYAEWFPEHLLLMDKPRWNQSALTTP